MWSAVCEKAHAECQRFLHGCKVCVVCDMLCVCDRDWLPVAWSAFHQCGLGHEFSETRIYYEFSETETRQACCVGWSYKIVTKSMSRHSCLKLKVFQRDFWRMNERPQQLEPARAGQRGGSPPANKMTFQSKQQQNNTAPLKPFLSLWWAPLVSASGQKPACMRTHVQSNM